MFVDIALALIAIGAIKRGYTNGLLATIFSTLGYVVGGVAGLYFSLQLVASWDSLIKQFVTVLVAIFLGAQMGLLIFGKLAKFFHARLLWKPFKTIDSLAGVALELIRLVVISYLVLTTLLWSPWSPVKTQINESQIYAQLDQRLPGVITDLKDRANELLKIDPISRTETKYVANELLNLRP
jgi:uncharacterized membrane protein required for colicin V production